MGKMLHKRKIKYMMGISHGSCTGAFDGKQLQPESEQWRAELGEMLETEVSH